MIFWLKSFNTPEHQKYTIGQINIYPLGQNVVQIITSAYFETLQDALLNRVLSFDLGVDFRWLAVARTSNRGGWCKLNASDNGVMEFHDRP